MRWKRRTPLPDEVRASLELPPGDQVRAAAPDTDGDWVVATDTALLVAGRRFEWTRIARASWDDENSVLTIETMATNDESAEVLRPVLPEPGPVPERVRERVEASIVASRRVPVRGGSVRVVARAVARSDELLWQVIFDGGVDQQAPEVQTAADEAIADLRRELRA